jgi:hypothetical protein
MTLPGATGDEGFERRQKRSMIARYDHRQVAGAAVEGQRLREAMSTYLAKITIAAAGVALLATANAATAGAGGRDSTFQMRNFKTFTIQRYPGDQAFAGGTVRFQGPDKGPYVERCYWTASPGVFGIPFGFTQHCYRYTLENTPE